MNKTWSVFGAISNRIQSNPFFSF